MRSVRRNEANLIERDVFNDDNPRLMVKIARDLGMEAVWFRYPGFGGDLEFTGPAPDLGNEPCVIVYGSIGMNYSLECF